MSIDRILAVTILLLASQWHGLLSAETVQAKITRVVDGDTVWAEVSGGEPIKCRLQGIDAPERNQPYGDKSTQYLARRIKGRTVTLEITGTVTQLSDNTRIFTGRLTTGETRTL